MADEIKTLPEYEEAHNRANKLSDAAAKFESQADVNQRLEEQQRVQEKRTDTLGAQTESELRQMHNRTFHPDDEDIEVEVDIEEPAPVEEPPPTPEEPPIEPQIQDVERKVDDAASSFEASVMNLQSQIDTLSEDIDEKDIFADTDPESSESRIEPLDIIIDPTDSTKLACRGGIWEVTINGVTQVNMPVSTSGDFSSSGDLSLASEITDSNPAALTANGTYYAYCVVFGTKLGEIAQASRMDVKLTAKDAARPIESDFTYQVTSIRVLAKATTDADGNITINPEHSGNIKTEALVLDSVNPSAIAAVTRASLGYHPTYGDLEIKKYSDVGTLKGMVLSPTADGGSNQANQFLYGSLVNNSEIDSIQEIVSELAENGTGVITFQKNTAQTGLREDGHFDLDNAGSGTDIDIWKMVDDYVVTGGFKHPHDEHDWRSDDHTGQAPGGVDRYLRTDGTASRNNMSGVIGDSSNLTTIDPDARLLVATDGATSIADWTTVFKVDDLQELTGAHGIDVGSDMISTNHSDIGTDTNYFTNIVGVNIGTATRTQSLTGDILNVDDIYAQGSFVTFYNNVDMNGNNMTGGNNIQTNGYVDADGGFKYSGTAGVSIASRLGGGIDIGSTHEVRVDQLNADDLVLVRR